jgi:hypothetical protein
VKGSVTGIELTAPLASVAQRAVAANGAAGAVSIVQADAGSCRRGQQVPTDGVDVIVLDVFDSGELDRVFVRVIQMDKGVITGATQSTQLQQPEVPVGGAGVLNLFDALGSKECV